MRALESVLAVAGFVCIVVGATLILYEVRRSSIAFERIARQAENIPERDEIDDEDLAHHVAVTGDVARSGLGDLAVTLRQARHLEAIGAVVAVVGAMCDLAAALVGIWRG